MEDYDHRVLARRLDLYHFEEDAPGMVYWHPAGLQVYHALESFIRKHMRRRGYEEVRTPQLLPKALWQKSGHWEKFGENMFAMERPERRDMALKPMSCPCHLQIFNSRRRSWRELPMRLCEFGSCHRDEPSGAMHGLLRTRGFEQDDAHVICRPEQVEGEVLRFVRLLREVYTELGFPDFDVALSLRPEKRAGSEEDWDLAEDRLLSASQAAGIEPRIQAGEGAFYGPKLEFALRDISGRQWQCGTIQLDMVLPKRLGALYIGEDGGQHVPVVLHHAVLGSLGRFIGILLEQWKGRLPLFLAPVQVAVLPIARAHVDAARMFLDSLSTGEVRAVMMDPSESLSRRLVMVHEKLIPIHLVIGRQEVETETVMLSKDGQECSVLMHDVLPEIVKGLPQ